MQELSKKNRCILHVIFKYDLQHKHDKIIKRIFNSELNINIFPNASFTMSRKHVAQVTCHVANTSSFESH